MSGAFRLKRVDFVTLPIGDSGDMSPRVKEALAAADALVCETAVGAKRALDLSGLSVAEKTLHEYNVHGSARDLEALGDELLTLYTRVAVISDAGAPVIADPGAALSAHLAPLGVSLYYVGGPVALVGALTVSGMPTEDFFFAGFLPREETAAVARLKALRNLNTTLVIYEAPHRLASLVSALVKGLSGPVAVCLCFDLTQKTQEVWRGRVEGLGKAFGAEKRKRPVTAVINVRTGSKVQDRGAPGENTQHRSGRHRL